MPLSSLSCTGKRWVLAPQRGEDTLPSNPDALITWLQESRQLSAADAHAGTAWYDPSLYPDSAKAAERTKRALANGERIALFGDYDCDGITATLQLYRFFQRRKSNPFVRLPHRIHDGYGLRSPHIDELLGKNITLLFAIDTGTSAHEAIERAQEKGMDVIVLDHHHLLVPPPAFAMLHPSLATDLPHPHPSAAGVVFSFLHALEGSDWKDRTIDLALATMGTVADLVHLQGNNRTLVQEGLRAFEKLPLCPLRSFVERIVPKGPVTSVDIAFRIAPRINAAGRMADPLLAFRALLEGGQLLEDLDTLNRSRQDETNRFFEDALQEIAHSPDGNLPAFLTVASASYPPGIVGLLAGKLLDRYGRPCMATHIAGDGTCTASLRSPPGFHITEALEKGKHLLLNFGGHAQAAGATFPLLNASALTQLLTEDASTHIPEDALVPTLALDASLPASAMTQDFCRKLQTLEPYGQGNPEPLFLLKRVQLTDLRRVGDRGKHLQATLGNAKLIGFNLGAYGETAARPLDIVCRLGLHHWNGRTSVQLSLVDLRKAETAIS